MSIKNQNKKSKTENQMFCCLVEHSASFLIKILTVEQKETKYRNEK